MAGTADVTVADRALDGPHGRLPVRIYTPVDAPGDAPAVTPGGTQADAQGSRADAAPAPARSGAPGLVWAHGGAFFAGDLDMPEADWVGRQLAARGIPVVSLDYRLAPLPDLAAIGGEPPADAPPLRDVERSPFPVASEEIAWAFGWVHEHAAEFGIDPERLSLGGASAGGKLTAGASLRLRDAGAVQPRSMMLAYPLLHSDMPEPSAELAAKITALPPELAFPREVTDMFNINYVGDASLLANPYAFPGTADLRGLPPAFILNSDADTLRASGEAYGAALVAAGVDTLVIREEGTRHGHLNEPQNPGAHRSIERMAAWLSTGPLTGSPHPDAG
ncbi:alpha/beta hydrolase fold domain-containing protein [Microbacterium sp. STN6]|uniref:alpha/beta hydrolase fold domain-containing protein n=1 Tax=Microbacterium sp. STN6 TaxID=2995588 RepID=UPI002260A5BD|nr:alpha/beta hydrolase fold domain-containing protein [Microbacterium sp. STN6]MCX7522551.1 alpha/beta hydrolase fold domain-containing protein [Microbacterium sp. STN6]